MLLISCLSLISAFFAVLLFPLFCPESVEVRRRVLLESSCVLVRVRETYELVPLGAEHLVVEGIEVELTFDIFCALLTEVIPRRVVLGPRWRSLHALHELKVEEIRRLRGRLLAITRCLRPAAFLRLGVTQRKTAGRCHRAAGLICVLTGFCLLLSHCNQLTCFFKLFA